MDKGVCCEEMALVKIALRKTRIYRGDVEECCVPDANKSRGEFAFLTTRVGMHKYVLKLSVAACQSPCLMRVFVGPNPDQRTVEDQVLFRVDRIERRNAGRAYEK